MIDAPDDTPSRTPRTTALLAARRRASEACPQGDLARYMMLAGELACHAKNLELELRAAAEERDSLSHYLKVTHIEQAATNEAIVQGVRDRLHDALPEYRGRPIEWLLGEIIRRAEAVSAKAALGSINGAVFLYGAGTDCKSVAHGSLGSIPSGPTTERK